MATLLFVLLLTACAEPASSSDTADCTVSTSVWNRRACMSARLARSWPLSPFGKPR